MRTSLILLIVLLMLLSFGLGYTLGEKAEREKNPVHQIENLLK